MRGELKNIPLIFENDHCLAFNKPPGLPVQGGEGVGASLDSLLAAAFPVRPLLVHRLDKDTSGIILAAKGREAAARLSELFSGRGPARVLKQYLAVCAGLPTPPAGTINTSLEVKGRIREALTVYRSRGAAALPGGGEAALLELEPGTGRLHQIRRHLARICHPILGDDKYGDFSLNRRLRKALGLRRLLLHASCLVIPPSPLFPQGLELRAPLPDYFAPFYNLNNAVKPTSKAP